MSATDNYAIVENGAVANVVIWDGDAATWQPPSGCVANKLPAGSPVGIGWATSDNVNYTAPAVS